MNNKELLKFISKNKNITIEYINQLEYTIYQNFLNNSLFIEIPILNLTTGMSFETLIENESTITPEIFSYLEELKLAINDNRHSSGSYYTNKFLVNNIINEKDILNKKLIDPAAGSGNFIINILLTLMDKFYNKDEFINYISSYIFYNDIKEESISVFIKRLNLITLNHFNQTLSNEDLIIIKNNIYNYDFLLENIPNKFDMIIGNPPYLGTKSLGKEYSKKIKDTFGFTDDLYSLFIYKSLELLNSNGFLGFITSSTYFTISTKHHLRKKLIDEGLYKIIINDDDNFNILTKTATLFLEKNNKNDYISLFQEKNKETILIKRIYTDELIINNRITVNDINSEVSSLFKESTEIYERYKKELSTAKNLSVFKETEEYYNLIRSNNVLPLGLLCYIATGVDFKGHNSTTLYSLDNTKYNIINDNDNIKNILSKNDFLYGLEDKTFIKAIKGNEHLFVKWNKEHFNFLKEIKAPLRNLSLYGDSDLLYCQTSTYFFNIVDKNTLCINTAGSGFIKLINEQLISLEEIKEQIENNDYKNYIKENINNSLCLTTNDLKYIPIKIK